MRLSSSKTVPYRHPKTYLTKIWLVVAPIWHQVVHMKIWALSCVMEKQKACQCYLVAQQALGPGELREKSPEVWQLARRHKGQ